MTEQYTPYEGSEEESYEWDYDDSTDGSKKKVLWGRVLALAVALFLAFLLGRGTAPQGVPTSRLTALENEVENLQQENEDLQSLLTNPTPSPTDEATDAGGADEEPQGQTYIVKRGDTLRGIAETFCGDAALDDLIADYNDIAEPENLPVGAEISIPPDCGD